MDSLTVVNVEINKIRISMDIFKRISYNQLLDQLSELEKAKLQVSLSYALASLLYILNHIAGDSSAIDVNKFIVEEIKNIKSYVLRLNECTDRESNSANQRQKDSGKKSTGKRPGGGIDREASKRMITHQIA